MRIVLIIIAAHCVVLGFGFLFAAWMSLLSPDKREIEDGMIEGQVAKEQGWRGIIGFAFFRQRNYNPLIARNWQNQPHIRKFLFLGFGFLAIAAIAGYALGVFN